MILGALIDLGVAPDTIAEYVARLGVDDFEIKATPCNLAGMTGTRVTVRVSDTDVDAHEHAPHRRLAAIVQLIEQSGLPPAVCEPAIHTFHNLAEAEAAVHGTTPEEIHFHEVGAMDAVVDIVGACTALHLLEIDAVDVGPLPLGRGTVVCRHGTLPVPVPATVSLLKNHPVIQTDVPHELVTPTGAALLSTWQAMRPMPPDPQPSRTTATGHGFGHRELESRPNLLRVRLTESTPPETAADHSCLVLECNLDDTIPELVGNLCQSLLRRGALDVYTTSVQMKKQRPGTLVTVLCDDAHRDVLLSTVFQESTTFGVREYTAARTTLARRFEEVATRFGAIRIKVGTWQGKDVTFAPEHEDCVQRAEENDVPVREVYEAALRRSLVSGQQSLERGVQSDQ